MLLKIHIILFFLFSLQLLQSYAQSADIHLPVESITAYTLEDALPGLTFTDPISITTPPGETNRLFIGEKGGKLWVVPDLNAPVLEKKLFLSIGNIPNAWESGLLGVAFHPNYASNGYFYVYYTPHFSTPEGNVGYNRLSRFKVSIDDPNLADLDSEQILINQLDKDIFHNAGDLHFGVDGYLYFTNGDGGDANDSFNVSQRLDLDYFSGLFRIDVDRLPGNPAPNDHPSVVLDPSTGEALYSVPADNPWVGATEFNGESVDSDKVIMEYYAIGLRNPFRFWIDGPTGNIWIGDVGQYAQEEVDISRGGENFGWAFREGVLDGPKIDQIPAGFIETPPIYTYPRSEGRAIIGGVLYRGDFYPELTGAYVFGDYVSGNIWALRYNGSFVSRELLTQATSLTEFDLHPATGEILVSVRNSGQVMKLRRSELTVNLPETLTDTGAFTSLADLTPAPGVFAYEPNLTFWSDHAIKQRWFALPDGQPIQYSLNDAWTAPTGGVWIKHFELELERGNPDSKKRIETRFLVKTEDGAYGVSYQWNDAGTEATLAPAVGVDLPLDIIDAYGESRTQNWRIPSRSECMQCHSAVSGFVLSFNARQLNRTTSFDGKYQNVLAALTKMKYLEGGPSDEEVKYIPAYATLDDDSQSIEYRARSYLAVNCAQCHQPGGSAISEIDLRPHLTLRETGIIDALPGNDAGGNSDPNNRVLAPGSPIHSVLLQRLCACNGFTRMPPLATSEIDEAGVALITKWINLLTGYITYSNWVMNYFSEGSPKINPSDDADGDGLSNEYEFSAGTNPTIYDNSWLPIIKAESGIVNISFNRPPNMPALIESSPNLKDWSVWEYGPQTLINSETSDTVEYEGAFDNTGFYRVVFPTLD